MTPRWWRRLRMILRQTWRRLRQTDRLATLLREYRESRQLVEQQREQITVLDEQLARLQVALEDQEARTGLGRWEA